ncbi:MAG: hypothetical protein QW390_04870, partial [Candidatus Bathyarchaeia archaeon]
MGEKGIQVVVQKPVEGIVFKHQMSEFGIIEVDDKDRPIYGEVDDLGSPIYGQKWVSWNWNNMEGAGDYEIIGYEK